MFLSRGRALDYAVETVFMRAKDRGVEVLDQEEFKNRMTGAEVRDRLGCGEEMRLVLGRDCTGEPMEYVSVCVCETEMDSGASRFRDLKDFGEIEYRGKTYRMWDVDVGKGRTETFAEAALQDALLENGDIDGGIDQSIAYYVGLDDNVKDTVNEYLE